MLRSEEVLPAHPYTQDYYEARGKCPFLRIEVQHTLQLLEPLVGRRLLELGCGAGALLSAAAARGADAVGLDVNRCALRTVGRSGAAVLAAGAQALPFSGETFDVVAAQHVIEHFAAPGQLLREWRRVLKPGGRLVLVTPNARYADPSVFYDADHKLIFTRRQLRDALTEAGFQVERAFTLFPYQGPDKIGAVARRLLWFRYLPWFAERGATIVALARKV